MKRIWGSERAERTVWEGFYDFILNTRPYQIECVVCAHVRFLLKFKIQSESIQLNFAIATNAFIMTVYFGSLDRPIAIVN